MVFKVGVYAYPEEWLHLPNIHFQFVNVIV